MNVFRKVTVLIIILCMFTVNITFVASENEMANSSAKINKLKTLGLWQDQEANDVVTRVGFAVLIADMLGFDELDFESETETFDDVDKNDPGYNAVEGLCRVGVVSIGNQDFRPNEAITYSEAVKMLVSALGYDSYAQLKGGYPSGYFVAASERNIIPNNLLKSIPSTLTYGDAAQMIDHAIDAEIFEQKSFGSNHQFVVNEDATVLTKYHNIYVAEGILEAVGKTRLSTANHLSKDESQIDGEVLNNGNTNPGEFLGYRVKGFYKKEKFDDQGTLLFIEQDETRNEIIELQHRQISSYKSGVLKYMEHEDRGKLSTINFPISLEVIINDQLSHDPEDLSAGNFENADKILFIDNNNDGQYDVLRIYIEQVMVVNSVNVNEKKVYGKYGINALDLKEEPGKEILLIDAKGYPVGFEEIVEWTILNIIRNADDSKVHVVVSNRKISGVVDEIETGYSWYEAKIKVNEAVYGVAKSVNDNNLLNDVMVGIRYTFYIDCYGKIAASDTDGQGYESNESYGYLIDARAKGISNIVEFKMFTRNNEFEIFKSAESVKIDGTNGLKGAKILSALQKDEYGLPTSTLEPTPVRYKLNAAGELTYIDTPYKGDREDPGNKDYDNNTLTRYKSYNQAGKINYLSSDRVFGGQVRLGAKSVIMYVPWYDEDPDKLSDIKYWSYDEVENWTIRTTNNIVGEFDTVFGSFSAYDVSKDRTANLVVIKVNDGGGEPIKAKTPVTIVEKITQGLDSEGNETHILHGYQNLDKIRVPFETGYNPNKKYGGKDPNDPNEPGAAYTVLEPGDLIRYALNRNGEINHYDKLFSFKDKDDPKVVRIGNEAVNPYMLDIQENTKSLLAVTTKKDSDTTHEPNPKIWYGSGYEFPGNAFYMAYGLISEKFGEVVMVEGVPGINTYRELFKTTNKSIYTIEEDTNGEIKIYPSKVDDLVSGSESGLDVASRVIYYTYSAKPGGLIIIKRNDR